MGDRYLHTCCWLDDLNYCAQFQRKKVMKMSESCQHMNEHVSVVDEAGQGEQRQEYTR